METKAPAGYQLPEGNDLVRKYFWFPEKADSQMPELPAGVEMQEVVDLTEGYGAFTVENSSTDKTTVTANKVWQNNNGTSVAPYGAKVTLALFIGNDEVPGSRIVLDGIADETVENDHAEVEAWHAEWANLDKMKAGGKIVYTVKEVAQENADGYTVKESSVETGGSIVNVEQSDTLSFAKEWYETTDNGVKKQNWPGSATTDSSDDATITVKLTRKLRIPAGQEDTFLEDSHFSITWVILNGTVQSEARTPSTANGSIERTSGQYSYEIKNLDHYGVIGTDAGVWEYSLSEEKVEIGNADKTSEYKISQNKSADGRITLINNNMSPLTLSVQKLWKDVNGETLSGEELPIASELTLYHKVDAEGADTITVMEYGKVAYYSKVVNNAQETTIENPALATADNGWTASFAGLDAFADEAGTTPETYLVRETAVYFGDVGNSANRRENISNYYTVSGGSVTRNTDGTLSAVITNRQAETSLNITKEWAGDAVSLQKYSDLTATFKLYKDGVAYKDKEDREVTITLTEADGKWSGTIDHLPRYRSDGQPVQWTLEETSVSYTKDGETVTLTGTGSTSITALFDVSAKDGNNDISIDANKASVPTSGRITFVNTLNRKNFTFHKVWYPFGTSTEKQAWQKDITVTLYKGDEDKVAEYVISNSSGSLSCKSVSKIPGQDAPNLVIEQPDQFDYLFTVENLPSGESFYLKESKMEQNLTQYGRMGEDNKIQIVQGAEKATADTPYIINRDTGGYELPSTGGSGTKLFTIIGSILVVSAGILLIRRRRRV